MHRRKILLKATRRGDETIARDFVSTGMNVHFDAEKAKEEEEEEEEEESRADDEKKGDGDVSGIPEKEDKSNAAVHLACVKGHLGCLQIFLESGVDVELRDEFGRTLLIAAFGGDHYEVVKYLLDKGADPTARCNDDKLCRQWLNAFAGGTCVDFAAHYGNNLEMLEHCLSKPDVEVTLRTLKPAMSGGHQSYKALELLLKRGGFAKKGVNGLGLDESNKELRATKMDAAQQVVQEADLKSTRMVLSYLYPGFRSGGTSRLKIPEELHKPFVYGAYTAIGKGWTNKFEWIYGLDIMEHDTMSLDELPEGQRLNIQHLLDTAAENGSLDSARFLIERCGADPHKYRLPSGLPPLYYATGNDKHEMVRYLLEKTSREYTLGERSVLGGPDCIMGCCPRKVFREHTRAFGIWRPI